VLLAEFLLFIHSEPYQSIQSKLEHCEVFQLIQYQKVIGHALRINSNDLEPNRKQNIQSSIHSQDVRLNLGATNLDTLKLGIGRITQNYTAFSEKIVEKNVLFLMIACSSFNEETSF